MENIINFYLLANKLKEVIRTGWVELKVSGERLESVAEHVYGSLVLAIAIESQEKLDLDMLKVFKMMILKELEKINLKELSTRDYQTDDERNAKRTEMITKLTSGLIKQDEIIAIINEFNEGITKEARFTKQLSKIEADLQAKIYDLKGKMDKDVALEDAKYFGEELANKIIPQINNASDGFILYDRAQYTDELFKNLSSAIQELKSM